jgi:hypothetical protein
MFKKVSHAYEVLIGKTKSQFFEEDMFADFFASFLRKYKSVLTFRSWLLTQAEWADDWNSPEATEARRKATEEMWEEEERLLQNDTRIRSQFIRIVEIGNKYGQQFCTDKILDDIPVWPEYAATEGIVSKFIFTNFQHSAVHPYSSGLSFYSYVLFPRC